VAKADLLLGASDLDALSGDAVSYDAMTRAGAQSATISEDNNYVYYEPANDNSDTLQYRLKDTRGGRATRNIQINVTARLAWPRVSLQAAGSRRSDSRAFPLQLRDPAEH